MAHVRQSDRVEILLLVVGLMLAAVLLVGLGDRLRLPWPALMLVLGVLVAAVPGLPDGFAINPDLILPNRAFYLTPDEQVKFVFSANRPGWADLVQPGQVCIFVF